MTRFAIDLSDRLVHGGRDLRFEGRRNDELDFRDDRSGERMTLTDLELAREISAGRAALVKSATNRRPGSPPPRNPFPDLALLAAEEREAARLRLAYVVAARGAGLECKASETALACCIAETARQRGDTSPPCTRSVRRWLKRDGRDAPTAGALVTLHRSKGNRRSRLAPEVDAIIEAKIDENYLKRPPISNETLTAHVTAEVGELNKELLTNFVAPSAEAVMRRVLARPPRDVHAARFGEESARQKFDHVMLQGNPEAPLDLVELDHTTTDMMVVCSRTWLPFGRATLAASLCRATRMPFGIYLGFEPPSVLTVMQCLRNGMLPKTYLDEKVASGEWDIKNDWPVCGRPRTLLLDRAMENLGVDLDASAGEIGIHLRFAPRKTPRYKGSIERFFRTLNKRLLHEQRGTTFSNILQRDDYDPAKNAVITLEELLYLIHKWLVDVYACSVHKGLRDVPRRLWDELVVRHPIQPVSSIADLDMMFGRLEDRVLQRTGITFEHIRYSSEQLVSLLADARFRRAAPDRRVRFRYDPADLGTIRVFDPCEQKYFTVPAANENEDYATGLSIWQHRLITTHVNQRNAKAVDRVALARAKVDIAAFFEKAMSSRKTGARKAAARHDGVGRTAPAGSRYSTSPQGSVDAARRNAPPTGARKSPRPKTAGQSSVALSDAVTPANDDLTINDEEDVYAALGIKR